MLLLRIRRQIVQFPVRIPQQIRLAGQDKFVAAIAQIVFCLPGRFQSNRSEEHTSELQSPCNLVCRLLLEKKQREPHHLPPTTPAATDAPERHSTRRRATRRREPEDAVRTSRLRRPRLPTFFFFFNDTPPTEIYPLPLHDALPIPTRGPSESSRWSLCRTWIGATPSSCTSKRSEEHTSELQSPCNLVCRLLLE